MKLAFVLLCFITASKAATIPFPLISQSRPADKAFVMYDDFSIPLAAGAVNGTTTTSNGVTWSTVTRQVTDTRSIIDIERPVPILPIGDSKTDAYHWPTHISSGTTRVWEYPSRFAKTGWPVTTAAQQISNYVYFLPERPIPANVLINLGANDITGSGAITEGPVKSNLWHIIKTMTNKWASPVPHFFIVKPWREDGVSYANATNWGIWISELCASNSSFCFVGPDERAFITNAAWSSDGVHPDTYAGALEWGARWRTNLIANWNTNALPIGAYLRYNTNNSSFSEQMLKHTTNVFNTGTSDGRVWRWELRGTAGYGIGTAESFRLSDGGWDYSLTTSFYESAVTNAMVRNWFSAPINPKIDFYFANFRGFSFNFVRTNGVNALVDVNFHHTAGNNWQWNLSVRNHNIGLHSVAVPVETWLPTPLCFDEFSNTLVSDGKFGGNQYKDLNGRYWPNGTNVSWTQRSGTWTVSSATLIPSAVDITNAVATVPGTGDVSVWGLCGTNAGVVARFTDTNNFIYTIHTGAGGTFELHTVVSGVDTIVKTASPTFQNNFSYHLMHVSGSNVVAQFGASQTSLSSYTITNAILMSGTDVGVVSRSTLNGGKKFGAMAIFANDPTPIFGNHYGSSY